MMPKLKTQQNLHQVVQAKLESGYSVRPFPNAVSRLLSAIKDPNSNSQTFADIVKLDVALSTRILKMVNSPIYGFTQEVRSVKQAVTVLGHRPLKNLALTFAGTSIINGNPTTRSHCEALWNHSLGCATVARLLAQTVRGADPDEAFLAGIFHDIGKLFLLDMLPLDYANQTKIAGGSGLQTWEDELCGMTHSEVGLKLAITWPLPDEVKGVIRYHHDPELESSENRLTKLINVADGLARYHGLGSSRSSNDSFMEKALEYFDLDPDAVDSIRIQSESSFKEASRIFAK